MFFWPWGLGCRVAVNGDRFWGEVTVNLLLRNLGMLALYRACLSLEAGKIICKAWLCSHSSSSKKDGGNPLRKP